jgi:hypothetical protein
MSTVFQFQMSKIGKIIKSDGGRPLFGLFFGTCLTDPQNLFPKTDGNGK